MDKNRYPRVVAPNCRKPQRRRPASDRWIVPVALVWCLFQCLNPAAARGQTRKYGSEAPASPANNDLPFTRLNTWSAFGQYSPDSSHIILGFAEKRRLVTLGGEYSRRISLRKWEALYYVAQVRPMVLESDPLMVGIRSLTTGQIVEHFKDPVRVVAIDHSLFPQEVGNHTVFFSRVYGKEWTYSAGLTPLGLKLNLAPHHRLQPVAMMAAGFLASARDVPVDNSSRFNFNFDFGLGVEWFYKPKRSLRFDYRIHHISNARIGATNPGIDSGLMQITYSFGK